MNQELVDEIEYTNELLANSGFFQQRGYCRNIGRTVY